MIIFDLSYSTTSPDILRSGGYCPFECFGHIMIMDFAISSGWLRAARRRSIN